MLTRDANKYINNNSNNVINGSMLNTVVDDDEEDETKIYDENDDRFINEMTDSNSNIQKLLTSQYLSDPNLHYSNNKNNQDQYYIRASNKTFYKYSPMIFSHDC